MPGKRCLCCVRCSSYEQTNWLLRALRPLGGPPSSCFVFWIDGTTDLSSESDLAYTYIINIYPTSECGYWRFYVIILSFWMWHLHNCSVLLMARLNRGVGFGQPLVKLCNRIGAIITIKNKAEKNKVELKMTCVFSQTYFQCVSECKCLNCGQLYLTGQTGFEQTFWNCVWVQTGLDSASFQCKCSVKLKSNAILFPLHYWFL